MKPALFALLGFALVALSGCGPTSAKLKGKVVEGNTPVLPNGLVSLSFHPIKADGSPDLMTVFTTPLEGDGTFKFVASGGTLPPGKYRVVIAGPGVAPPTGKTKIKSSPNRFGDSSNVETSKLHITVQPGQNDLVIDLAKPSE